MLFQRTVNTQASAEAPISDESALVARAKALEGRAWEELFAAHYQPLCRFLRFRLGEQTAAEDIASQVFVEAIAGIERYEYRGRPLSAWLYRIARNLISDYVRAKSRDAGIHIEPSSEESPLRIVERDFEQQQLVVAMERLTDEQREVVFLRFFSELPTAETARTMGRTEGAVKAMQHRALATMRRVLSPSEIAD